MKSKKIISSILTVTVLLSACSCGKKEETTATASETSETSAEAVKTETPELEGYNILWSDEFDGDAMDESKWSYDPHEPGWTNNELQEYTTSTRTRPISSTVKSLFPLKSRKARVCGRRSG